ncbi:MAG: hypothetical protein HQK99_08040 [Nitrospirae bacterium]|nr:hypothetical protein [Nitrospirota bacterium]
MFKYAAIVFYFIEIFSFYFIVMDGLASRLEPDPPLNMYNESVPYLYNDYQEDLNKVKEIFNVKPYKYQNVRVRDNTTHDLLPAFKKYMTASSSIDYSAYYVDVCIPKLRHEMLPLGIDRYYRARRGLDIDKIFINVVSEVYKLENDPVTMNVFGCDRSKLRIAYNVVFAGNLDDAAYKIDTVLSSSDPYSYPVIIRNSVEEYALANNPKKNETINVSTGDMNKISIEGENINVLFFTANTIILEAFTDNEKAWLIYADSYNPNWTAKVNGQYRSIAISNLAFKAVKLDKGNNKVIFNFKGNHQTLLYVRYFIALSVLFWLYILFITLRPEFIVGESNGSP